MKQKILTLRQIYKEGAGILEKAGIAEAELDAWFLLSDVTGISRASYYGNPDREVSGQDAERYFTYIARRGKRIPLQHITGEQEFMGYTFFVNEHVLIPRQDTEVLVEEALKVLKPGMRILDLCTGSGCILISLLRMAADRLGIDVLTGVGTDISEKALSVAGKNAENLETPVELVQGDLFENVEGRFHLIVSNPPYIPESVIEGLPDEVKIYDPYIALNGGEDGLHFYRRIIKESVAYMEDGGFLMFETGYDQGKAVSGLLKDSGYEKVSVKKDLAGLDRVVCGMYNGK